MRQILAIDQGTHATRAIVFDGQGRVVASAQQAVALHRHSRSEVEQDAMEILASMRTVITEVLAAPRTRRRHQCRRTRHGDRVWWPGIV
jgi:glycerol kinase